jgi:hypothetical protein
LDDAMGAAVGNVSATKQGDEAQATKRHHFHY